MAGTATDILLYTGSASDGDWDTAGNWVTLSGSPTTTTPSAGEGVAMNYLSVFDLTVSPGSSVDLNNFRVAPGTRCNFGSASTPITNVVVSSGTNPKMTYGGDCPGFYFSGNIDILNVNRTGGGDFVLVGGTATEAVFQSGRVTIGGAAAFTNGLVSGATVTVLKDSGAAPTLVEIVGGSYTTERDYTQIIQTGGVVVTRMAAKASTAHRLYGGLLDVQSSGTIALLRGVGGRATAANAQRPFTLTLLEENAKPGMFVFEEEASGSLVTVTTRKTIGSKL